MSLLSVSNEATGLYRLAPHGQGQRCGKLPKNKKRAGSPTAARAFKFTYLPGP
jgi:hypothetical protein